jgi:membrane-bound ClpP family serine protease
MNLINCARNSLLVVGGAFAGMVGFALIMHRYLPNTPILARLMLPTQGTHQEKQDRDESLNGYQSLLGQVGRTTTQLTPSGKATFAGKLVDVISDAELIPVDIEVEVVEVRGGHVLVRVVEI